MSYHRNGAGDRGRLTEQYLAEPNGYHRERLTPTGGLGAPPSKFPFPGFPGGLPGPVPAHRGAVPVKFGGANIFPKQFRVGDVVDVTGPFAGLIQGQVRVKFTGTSWLSPVLQGPASASIVVPQGARTGLCEVEVNGRRVFGTNCVVDPGKRRVGGHGGPSQRTQSTQRGELLGLGAVARNGASLLGARSRTVLTTVSPAGAPAKRVQMTAQRTIAKPPVIVVPTMASIAAARKPTPAPTRGVVAKRPLSPKERLQVLPLVEAPAPPRTRRRVPEHEPPVKAPVLMRPAAKKVVFTPVAKKPAPAPPRTDLVQDLQETAEKEREWTDRQPPSEGGISTPWKAPPLSETPPVPTVYPLMPPELPPEVTPMATSRKGPNWQMMGLGAAVLLGVYMLGRRR